MWDASKCDLCGKCLMKCLYVDYDKDKAVAEMKALMEDKKAEILSKCITCCACREYCPTGADPYDLICKTQSRKGYPITDTMIAMMDRSFEATSGLLPGLPDKPILSLCVMEFGLPEGALDGQLFQGLTVVKGVEYFCYEGYVHAGTARESFLQNGAYKFIANLTNLGKDIILLHDECYAMAHVLAKEYGMSVPFKYMHIFEYLLDYLRGHRSGMIKLGNKVAYQRPCSSRYTPEKDILLDEIFEIIGVERVARKYDRENALCCSGHAVRRAFPELSAELQAKNVNDALEFGADAMIILCPMCNRQLERATSERGLKQIYITDLCRMALGEKPWPE